MMFTESALNFSGLCLTMKRKTLKLLIGTKPYGEIKLGLSTNLLSIADVASSKICTDKLNPRLMKVNRGFLFLTKKIINQGFITLNNPKYMCYTYILI